MLLGFFSALGRCAEQTITSNEEANNIIVFIATKSHLLVLPCQLPFSHLQPTAFSCDLL